MTRELEGQVAVVTGAAYGIGREIARTLAEAGASVLVAARGARVEETAAVLAEDGLAVAAQRVDIRDPASAAALMEGAVERFGRLDILVNNAAAPRTAKLLLELEPRDWEEHLATNVTGSFVCLRAAARTMITAGRGGRIVSVSSMAGQRPMLRRAHYSASKAALESLSRSAAVELAEHQITVNAIAPGFIETETSAAMQAGSLSGADARYLVGLRERIPAARLGTPTEVAMVARFLVSPAAAYLTGQVVTIDGALTV